MLTSIFLILNLFILESLLSVDNAAVLALMVKDLPAPDRPKALKYGLLGAFVFRGLCLVLASWLVHFLVLKLLGGIYLIYLTIGHFTPKHDTLEEGVKKENRIFKAFRKMLGAFWGTVLMVEIMDIAFSIDNIFAAVAFTNQIVLIMIGVFMGIVAMRFIANWFCKLIDKYHSLETSAFIVIGILGMKLIVEFVLPLKWVMKRLPEVVQYKEIMDSHTFSFAFSGVMMIIFFVPLLFTKPRHALQEI